jgi:hypothetical protein
MVTLRVTRCSIAYRPLGSFREAHELAARSAPHAGDPMTRGRLAAQDASMCAAIAAHRFARQTTLEEIDNHRLG